MTLESYRAYCLSLKGVTEEFPFGEETLVFKVMGKMFSATDVVNFESINLKCDPEVGVDLRERYPAVTPGYHMNKKHWITIAMNEGVSDRLIRTWIDNSYGLVIKGLSRSEKLTLESL